MKAGVRAVRVELTCPDCGRAAPFYIPLDLVVFLGKQSAPAALPLTTRKCRSCGLFIPVTYKDVAFRAAA